MSTHLLINPSHRSIDKALVGRAQSLLERMTEEEMQEYLGEMVYLERHRFQQEGSSMDDREVELVEGVARSLYEGSEAMRDATMRLVTLYSQEVHNRFSERAFGAALKLAPAALKRLLAPSDTSLPIWSRIDAKDRIQIQGPVDRIRTLSATHTLVYAPTHLSNLDSPLVGYALNQAGLPPCTYGAGLNLFSNPFMAFFMARLGAYTVDRRKRHRLYKDVLKAYSTEIIGRGAHSLFYPGGTRSRTGSIETNVKRGLLGTAIEAWQEGLRDGRERPEVLVVPVTISSSLVLEAETLIEDALAVEGKARYIISDDEFSQPTTVIRFARQLAELDVSVVVRFGSPMDLVGNPVNADGQSLDGLGNPFDRRGYVCNESDRVMADSQRDRVYTNHLADAICRAYRRDTVLLPTHVAAWVGWRCLAMRLPGLDRYRLALLAPFERWVDRQVFIDELKATLDRVQGWESSGVVNTLLPRGADAADAVLAAAVDTFSRFHSRPALSCEDWRILVDPKLCLYYGNRLQSIEQHGEHTV